MKCIEVISIPVSNQEKAKAFYLKLGFSILAETSFAEGRQWIQLGLPGAQTSITLVNWFPQMPAGCMQGLVIDTSDIKDAVDKLNEQGIAVDTVDDTPWGKFASFRDPDGNTLSLHQK